MTLGEKIKKARLEKGMTQDELASKLFVKRQTVSKWEQCINEPDIATIKKLAEIFSITIDELLDMNEQKTSEICSKKEKSIKILYLIQIWFASFALLNAFGMMAFLPNIVPIHFDINWNVDRYSSKWELFVLFLPIFIMIIISTIFYVMYRRKKNVATIFKCYFGSFIAYFSIMLAATISIAILEIVVLMLYVPTWDVLLYVRIFTFEIGAILLPLSIMSYPIFNPLPNPYFGFRTFTSLSNPKVWYKLNRLASILMFFASLLIYILPLVIDSSYYVSFVIFSIIVFLLPVFVLNELERRKLNHIQR